MTRLHDLFEHWGSLFAAFVLLGLAAAGWSYRGVVSSMDIVVGGIGLGALLVAVDDFLGRRELARRQRNKASRRRITTRFELRQTP